MAGSNMGRQGRGGHGTKQRYQQMSEINVTPFVDVMLVLLIVFMVTAPLMTVGVPVDLPKTKAAQINDSEEPLVLSIDADGLLYIQETSVELDALVPRLQAITGNNPDIRIFVRGDKSIPYGQVMEVMGLVSSAGFKKVALLAKLPGQN
ncbi:protein TolR [Curvivirga aplysinae]|uniref:protein TolR n=1 Tax=Curvivirga aplysinae TaxID=2529852 RepID=UPI001C3FDBEC|nr:protein TolR [Curvivirga aplysinae]